MDKNSIVIAIDGPSASGKGLIARGCAAALHFAHLETGLLYRWVGKQWLARGGMGDGRGENLDLAEAIAQELAANFSLELLNDPLLRSNEVAEAASIISAQAPVRAALLTLQRYFAQNPAKFLPSPFSLLPSVKGAILDGRDIGSVVCPQAQVKLYVTATPEVRAERRRKELQTLGQMVSYEQVFAEVATRDERDRTRAAAPLQTPAGSIIIDTSNLSAEESIEQALGIIRQRLPQLA